MTVFISYARKDRELVHVLASDVARAKQLVWLDRELTGGQDWWDTILGHIRDCELFIFVLTPDSIRSKACLAELGYASDLARPILRGSTYRGRCHFSTLGVPAHRRVLKGV